MTNPASAPDRGAPAPAWFLAQIKPNCDQIAERNLRRQGFGVFRPVQEETRRTNGKFVTRFWPVFPGYLFVGLDTGSGHWRAVNSTQGITRLVSFGPAPAPVPPALIAELRARCDAEGRLQPAPAVEPVFAPGDAVTMTRGPFAEIVATIEAAAPDRRVWVLLEIMGRQSRLAVDPGDLRGLGDAAPKPPGQGR